MIYMYFSMDGMSDALKQAKNYIGGKYSFILNEKKYFIKKFNGHSKPLEDIDLTVTIKDLIKNVFDNSVYLTIDELYDRDSFINKNSSKDLSEYFIDEKLLEKKLPEEGTIYLSESIFLDRIKFRIDDYSITISDVILNGEDGIITLSDAKLFIEKESEIKSSFHYKFIDKAKKYFEIEKSYKEEIPPKIDELFLEKIKSFENANFLIHASLIKFYFDPISYEKKFYLEKDLIDLLDLLGEDTQKREFPCSLTLYNFLSNLVKKIGKKAWKLSYSENLIIYEFLKLKIKFHEDLNSKIIQFDKKIPLIHIISNANPGNYIEISDKEAITNIFSSKFNKDNTISLERKLQEFPTSTLFFGFDTNSKKKT